MVGVKFPMTAVYAWIKFLLLALLACFLMLFGIHLLISAYQLNDPFDFVMTFFASNLIILIGAAFLVGFFFKVVNFYRKSENDIT